MVNYEPWPFGNESDHHAPAYARQGHVAGKFYAVFHPRVAPCRAYELWTLSAYFVTKTSF